MDSVTQFALGATIGVVTLSGKIGARKAAITGGLVATLPDLDVLVRFDDPVDQFVLHRGPTHSLFILTLATPVIGELLRRFVPGLKDARWTVWATVWLCLITHALLDAMTVYGTRLFWPLWPEPVGVGSVFIIDPLYTVPLLVVVIWAIASGGFSKRLVRVSASAVALSTAYLAWSVAAQAMAMSRGEEALQQSGVSTDQIMATPTPFNTLFWRIIAVADDRYYNVYVPLLGGAETTTVYSHVRGKVTEKCLTRITAVRRLSSFADGFIRIDKREGTLVVSDLRMGLTPEYVFRFAVASESPDLLLTGAPGFVSAGLPTQIRPDRDYDSDFDWLQAGITGERMIRPTESGHIVLSGAGKADRTQSVEC